MAFEQETQRTPTAPVGRIRVILIDEDGTTEGRSSHRTVTVNDQNGNEITRQDGPLVVSEDMTGVSQAELESFVSTLKGASNTDRLRALVAYLQDNLRSTAEDAIFPG